MLHFGDGSLLATNATYVAVVEFRQSNFGWQYEILQHLRNFVG